MYFKYLVKIPENTGKITYNRRGETVYVEYEYDRIYYPEKKYNAPKRTSIGKQSKEDPTMMYPNPSFMKYFPDVELPGENSPADRSCCLKIGTYLAIRKIIDDYGLSDMLERIIGKDYGLFLDLIAYSIITENNAGQYYPDYAFNHPLFTEGMRIYSDSKVSSFLNSMTVDQSVAFLNQWNESRDHRERIYISYDSTNKNCQAGDIEIAEFGHAKEDLGLPVINYSIAYDKTNREPLFYEEYPGSIVDISQLQYMLEKAKGYGYRKAGFILDRGYFSKENIRYMDKCGFDFVIMMKGMKSMVRDLILESKGKFEDARANSIREFRVNGITVKHKLFPSDAKERYFHLFYSSGKYASEREQIEMKIDHMQRVLKKMADMPVRPPEEYNKYFEMVYYHEGQEDEKFLYGIEKSEVIDHEISLCGYFVIITSQRMTAREAISLYKSRDGSEKLFRGDKSYLGNKSLRVPSQQAADAKIFIEFVALIVRNRMYTCLKDAMAEMDEKPNYMTVPAAIRELEKIEMVRLLDDRYRMNHAATKTQKKILKAFGIDALHIKASTQKLSDRLAYIIQEEN